MAVTKRIRFEVLRRDQHRCRYCGADDVKLTVDHVLPVALGGGDDPSNLVAACAPCNAGKSSTSPSADLVSDVRADALRHAELTKQAYAVLVETMGARDDYIDEFDAVYGYGMPDDWRNTIGRWFEMGVPVELVVDAARIANAKTQSFSGTQRFTYFCGIVWNQVRLVGEQVAAKDALDAAWWTDAQLNKALAQAHDGGYDTGKRQHVGDMVLQDFVDRNAIPPRWVRNPKFAQVAP